MAYLPDPGELLPVPSTRVLKRALEYEGSIELCPFSQVELAAVGAASPVRGLVLRGPLLSTDESTVKDELILSLQDLAARDLVGQPIESDRTDGGVAAEADGPRPIRLGGDLAIVVAIRRAPALILTAALSAVRNDPQPGPPDAADRVIAVLHGFATERDGLLGFLEETLSEGTDAMHRFTLSTPARQALRLLEAWRELTGSGREAASLSVHVYIPDPQAPTHRELIVFREESEVESAAVGLLSSTGARWEKRIELDKRAGAARWEVLFEQAVRLPARP